MKQPFVFFGSGPVALESLRLLKQDFIIEAIITKKATEQEMSSACPDTPLFSVSNNQELERIITEQSFRSQVGVLIDFGVIVSQKVIDAFLKGIVNSHFSLLPELRGADPISFAILEGKIETGVSLMLLVKAMDEGPLLAQARHRLTGTENTPELTEKLVQISYRLIKENLEKYLSDQLRAQDQAAWQQRNRKEASYTRKLTKQDGLIDWHKTADRLQREIRAYAQWPKSRARLGEIDVILTKARVLDQTGNPGILFIHDKSLAVHCGDQALLIENLVPVGKKPMDSQAFLAGYKHRLHL